MMKAVTHVFLLSIFILSSGFSLFSNEPSDDDIRLGMGGFVPSWVRISDVDIKAQENAGSESSPKFMTRFTADLELETATYQSVSWIGGDVRATVVRLKLPEGAELKAFGKATSILKREKWESTVTEFELEGNVGGEPLSKFENPVVEGTAQHEEAIKKYEAWVATEEARQAKEAKEYEALMAKNAKEKEARIAKESSKLASISKGLTGEWLGHYVCGQGHTSLTLVIDAMENGGMGAIFKFYPSDVNPGTPSGSYSLKGKFTSKNSFDLSPVAWIKHPKGYGMVGLKGKKVGNKLTGTITSRYCSGFEVNKK